jgi:hypothetical protein
MICSCVQDRLSVLKVPECRFLSLPLLISVDLGQKVQFLNLTDPSESSLGFGFCDVGVRYLVP